MLGKISSGAESKSRAEVVDEMKKKIKLNIETVSA